MILVQRMKPEYFEPIENQIISIIYEVLFRPLQEILLGATKQMPRSEFPNSKSQNESVLRQAIRSGRIQYVDGTFTGQFNAAISNALRSLGAKFDKRSATYKLFLLDVPPWIRQEADLYQLTAQQVNKELQKTLNYIKQSLDDVLPAHTVHSEKTVNKIVKDFTPIANRIRIYPKLSEHVKAQISKEYNQNMELWIRKFVEKEIIDLRKIVQDNAESGFRFDELIPKISWRYGVSQRKAKFLARQETSLFMSKFHESRFAEAGIDDYTWSTSKDERVRHSHAKLNGKSFSYASPPIVDDSTGRRANPGQDYNCRCVAIPHLPARLKAA